MRRIRTRYETAFALAVAALAIGAVFAFTMLAPSLRREANGAPPRAVARAASPQRIDEGALVGGRAIAATQADYEAFEAEDAAWRQRNARLPDLFELRRRALEERVYLLNSAGRRRDAIRELERWTERYTHDREAVLWLARLLREAGRTNESLARYRQLLAVQQRPR